MIRCTIILTVFFFQHANAQENKLVYNIDSMIEKIERLIPSTTNKIKDTIIYGIHERSKLPDTQFVHTKYFFSDRSLIKVINYTKYKNWTDTEIIYVQDEKPIKYNRQSHYLDLLKDDFDIYFRDDKAVYQTERVGAGKPYAPAFLSFCYQIIKSR